MSEPNSISDKKEVTPNVTTSEILYKKLTWEHYEKSKHLQSFTKGFFEEDLNIIGTYNFKANVINI